MGAIIYYFTQNPCSHKFLFFVLGLDSTDEGEHVIVAFLSLILLNMKISSSIHFLANGIISFFLYG
jgi:hypothetical protein